MSYVVDVYRGEAKVQYNPITLATYVAMFPQLIAGPIVLPSEMLPQFADPDNKSPKAANIYLGARAFIYGLAKKVLIAVCALIIMMILKFHI